jgi:6-phosphogluconate dehydrogenase
MQLGLAGLGRMGANMALRLTRGGHQVVGFDPSAQAREHAVGSGIAAVDSLHSLIASLGSSRIVWLMVPAGNAVDAALAELTPLLHVGDIVVDGGNSYYRDSMRRAQALSAHGIDYIDCGTSGGIWGLDEGYSLMLGGAEPVVERLRSVFETLAPAKDRGWGRVGPSGAGHFVKMIHNGIEYGMMQAYAEGFSVLKHKQEFALDLHEVAEIWRVGSVVRSWLLDLTSDALKTDADLAAIAPYVDDSGEGRWTVAEAIELGVATPVIAQALLARVRSRDVESFSDRLLAALRHEFGAHPVKSVTKP